MDPTNTNYKRELTTIKRTLKKTIKKNKLTYKETIVNKMQMSKKDSKSFWKLLDKLDDKQRDTHLKNNISEERWTTYFRSIFNNPWHFTTS